MKYKIVWSAFSENQIDDIFNYYTQKATYKVALDIVTQILLAPDILIDNPKIGQKEHHYKIDYLRITIFYRQIIKSFILLMIMKC